MPAVSFDAVNPFFKSNYATLGAIIQSTRPVLAKYGLAVTQHPFESGSGHIGVETVLIHESGQWMSSEVAVRVKEKNTAQAAGSTLTYLRRYSLAAVLGIYADADDDGNPGGPITRTPEPKPVQVPTMSLDTASDIKGSDGKRYGDCTDEELRGKQIGMTKNYGRPSARPGSAEKAECGQCYTRKQKGKIMNPIIYVLFNLFVGLILCMSIVLVIFMIIHLSKTAIDYLKEK